MSRSHPAWVLVALLLAACAGVTPSPVPGTAALGARPALEIRLVDRPYAISARGVRALNRALGERGPRLEGRSAHAITDWRLHWSYVPVRDGGRCIAGAPRVELELVTSLPRWEDAAEAPERLRDDWSLFLGRLRSHEAVHQDLAVDNGRELLGRLQDLAARDCDALRLRAAATAAGVEGRYRDLHAAFDRRTRFGREPEADGNAANPSAPGRRARSREGG